MRPDPLRPVRAPRIETKRLILRAHSTDDFRDCATLWGSAEVTRFIGGSPRPPQDAWFRILRYAGHWTLLGYGFWAIIDKSTGAYLGEGGFSDFRRGIAALDAVPEMGWALMPNIWGKGFAKEAVAAFANWGDANLGVSETACIISPDNHASIRVADYIGFSPVDEITYDGEPTTIFKRSKGAPHRA
jgi:RimJ/RimL family protein N-acetyltransferase